MKISRAKPCAEIFGICLNKRFSSSSWLNGLSSSNTTNESVRNYQNKLFEEEYARQMSFITRIEKIEVKVEGPPFDSSEDTLLIMNKGLSTPYNCAMHLTSFVRDMSAIAVVNGRQWDMHRPLTENCQLKFMHFQQADPRLANRAYWRSCSFILGMIAAKAFKDEHYVELHSWPSPSVESGSFVYDIGLNIDNWKPTKVKLEVREKIMIYLK